MDKSINSSWKEDIAYKYEHMNNKNHPPHPVRMDGAPILHRKHGGCSNAEQNPHEGC